MNISELSRMLSYRAETVARELLPQGKREGTEWRVGGIDGDPGKSMGVKISGSKQGVWCDFATGEAGDLVDLWANTRFGGDISRALEEIKTFLGVSRTEFHTYKREYTKPAKPKCSTPQNAALEFLHGRGFNTETIKAYKVAADNRQIYFPFLRDDELIMCKWRSITDKKTAPTSANQEPCLFGWQAIPTNAREIYLTEGEFDAMAMYQMGFPALSVPFGGGDGAKQQWIETEFDNLDRFERIYLCLDADEMGEKAAREIANRLGLERCLWVTLPLKDANECLLNGVCIREAITTAKNFDPAALKNAGDYIDQVIDEFYPPAGKEEFIPIPWSKMRGKLELRDSELSIWAGMNGSGKSQVLGYVAMRAIQKGRTICIASMELKPAKLLKRMARQAAAVSGCAPSIPYIRAVMELMAEKLWIFDCVGTAKKDELIKTARYAKRRYGVDLFIVDSLMKCGIGEDDYTGQKLFVEDLCDLKNELDFHIALVCHSKKKESEFEKIGKMDVKGSGAITDLADTVLTVWRNKAKENKLENPGEDDDLSEIEMEPDALIGCDKQRNGEWEGRFALWFDRHTWQYLEGHSAKPYPLIPNWQEQTA